MSIVDRCVCHDVPLTSIRDRIDELRSAGDVPEDILLARLADELKCTTGCGMCKPYIRLTMRTGRTAFDHREQIVRAVADEEI
ncbi:MAG: hypothetical protein AAGA55_05980 [Planctomycetota bacterium]